MDGKLRARGRPERRLRWVSGAERIYRGGRGRGVGILTSTSAAPNAEPVGARVEAASGSPLSEFEFEVELEEACAAFTANGEPDADVDVRRGGRGVLHPSGNQAMQISMQKNSLRAAPVHGSRRKGCIGCGGGGGGCGEEPELKLTAPLVMETQLLVRVGAAAAEREDPCLRSPADAAEDKEVQVLDSDEALYLAHRGRLGRGRGCREEWVRCLWDVHEFWSYRLFCFSSSAGQTDLTPVNANTDITAHKAMRAPTQSIALSFELSSEVGSSARSPRLVVTRVCSASPERMAAARVGARTWTRKESGEERNEILNSWRLPDSNGVSAILEYGVCQGGKLVNRLDYLPVRASHYT
ncbi:hypothetical protein B0H13DRAFT_2510068 [Mycena leptocephala]|nr:hypothetical protein B0H13DRAFT_2510068 [Mycena leptocephala]